MEMLTPKEIVLELDKYIVGQNKAKRAVAIALRNRWRRQQVSEDLREEIAPKNIIMIGPTGVGKTEIARRLAKLAEAPFIKVEASKFTEVGYVGRDVESIIRDLTELSVKMAKEEEKQKVYRKAEEIAEEKLLDVLLPVSPTAKPVSLDKPYEETTLPEQTQSSSREKLRALFRAGKLNERIVELEVSERQMPMVEIFSASGIEEMGLNIKEMFGNLFPNKSKKRRVKVPEAYQMLIQEESSKLIDSEKVQQMAVQRVEQSGIVFLDEIDKIAGGGSSHGPDVSREGVQRDLLPIVEGSTVNTKYGMVKTDHILFIAAGAFHSAKPSDLLPELQGRFPIRVELDTLYKDDFIRILQEPKNALIKQYVELLKTENIELDFGGDAIENIAEMAMKVNETTENIGARRLHTIMEKLLEDISFNATEMSEKKVSIDADYVKEKLLELVKDEDLSKYIL